MFTKKNNLYPFFPLFFSVLLSLNFLLTSCLGGGGDGGGDDGSAVSGSGLVGVGGMALGGSGADGPIEEGNISVFNGDGFCDSATTSSTAKYSLVLANTCQPPFKLELSGGNDMVVNLFNDSEMLSLAITDGNINISPLTTIMFHAAMARAQDDLAEVQSEDLDLAAEWAMRNFNFGIDSAGTESNTFNPLTSIIDATNSSAFVKANEGLIETARRVSLLWQGEVTIGSIGLALETLGRDISDGQLDGITINGIETQEMAELVSLWEVTAATVSMEMMFNQMYITLTDRQGEQAGYYEISPEDAASRLAFAVSAISSVDPAAAGIELNNMKPSLLFINQARAAALVAQDLAYQTGVAGGVATYQSFIDALDQMKAALDSNGITSLSLEQVLSQDLLTDITIDAAAVTDSFSDSVDYSAALQQPTTVYNESTPVLKDNWSVYVEWSYGGSSSGIEGFRFYRVINNSHVLVCDVDDPSVRNTAGYENECAVDAQIGDEVTLYMTAYNDSLQLESEYSEIGSYSNTIPQAQFTTENPINGECPLDIVFYANEEAAPDQTVTREYSWDFDNGFSDLVAFPETSTGFTFDYPQTYSVEMTVIDTDFSGVFSTKSQAKLNVSCW